ncbi:MAG TPA: hypothetical protein VIU38_01235, partial [Anaerolineales bacterium]
IILHGNQFDDAYITYRYAINLADGRGLVFNPGEKVNSASSLSYALLLAAIHRAGVDNLEQAAALIGVLSGCILLVYASLLGRRLSGSTWITALFVIPLAVSGSLTAWSVSGMETLFYAAMLIMFFYYLAGRRILPAGGLLILSMLTRPEAVILLVGLAAAGVALIWLRQNPGPVVPLVLAGGSAIAVYYVFNELYYGSFVPQSAWHKQVTLFYAPDPVEKVRRFAEFMLSEHAVLTLLGAAFCLVILLQLLRALKTHKLQSLSDKPNALVNLTLAAFIVGSAMSLTLGPISIGHRYEVPLLPILAVAAAAVCEYGRRSYALSTSAAKQPLMAIVVAGILVLGPVQALLSYQAHASETLAAAEHQRLRRAMGEWIEAHVPTDQPVLSHDLGAISYFALQHRFIDVEGLISAEPLMAVRQGDWERFIDYLREEKPLWAADTLGPDGVPAAFHMVRRPTEYFRGLRGSSNDLLDLESPLNKLEMRWDIPGGRSFGIVAIDPSLYGE